jgi:intein-encoded DNA endonuclease-like protein
METSSRWIKKGAEFPTVDEQLAYARGYFDAEGSVPHDPAARFYIQLVQKNRSDIEALRQMLELVGIRCGKLHNPSVRVDNEMWRFYVLAESHRAFAKRVSSRHPRTRRRLDRMVDRTG